MPFLISFNDKIPRDVLQHALAVADLYYKNFTACLSGSLPNHGDT